MFFSIHLVHLGLQSEYISDIPAASVFLLHTYLYFHTHNTAVSYDFSAAYAPSVLSHHKDNSGHFSNEIPENPPCFSNHNQLHLEHHIIRDILFGFIVLLVTPFIPQILIAAQIVL